MSDFVDDKAVTERGEKPEEEEEFAGLPEDEPEASDSGGSSGSDGSSDEEEDEGNEDDKKFLADEVEEEEEGEGEEGDGEEDEQKRKKKKRRHRDLVLEEEDYELLEENTGVRQIRPQGHRRLKKARDMGGDNERDAAAALRAELFGEEGEADLEDDIEDPNAGAAGVDEMPEDDLGDGGGGAGRDRADDDEFLESDEDDWIVNEYDDALGGEDAQRQQQQRRRRRAQQAEDLFGVDAAALAEANDIFGDVDALLQRYNEGRMERQRVADGEMHALGQDDDDDDTLLDGIDLEGLDEEEIEDLKESKREERRAQVAARKLQQQLEPGAMERHFMLPADERIRETDVPEREQLRRGRDPKNFDFDACAEWVYTELMKERRGAYDKMAELIDDGVREVEGPPPEWMHIASWAPPDEKGKTIELLRGGHAQLHGGTRGLYEGRKTNKEVKTWRENEDAQEALKKAIRTAVELIYKYHEEVPVLGMYRKEVLGELLALRSVDEPANHIEEEILADGSKNPNYGLLKAADRRVRRWDVLWAVQKLTQKWKSLQRLKEAREKSFNEALTAAATVEERNAVQDCLDALEAVTSIESLEDLDAKFRLVAPAPEDAVAALSLEGPEGDGGEDGAAAATAAAAAAAKKDQRGGIPRRARRANAHQIAVKAGLQDAARSLGLSAAQFAENLIGGYQVHVTTDPSVPPMELAAQFVDPNVPARQTPDLVLRSATLILAAEIAAEPAVRKTVRDFFYEKARLSTLVTPAGAATLTPFHPLGVAKRLHDKRIKDFKSDTYLRVLEAEKAGYIKVKISLGGRDNDVLPQMLFLSGSVTPESQAWNELRVQVLKEALHFGLLPALEREAKAKLALDARTVVAMETAKALWETAIAPPIDLRDDEDVEVAEKRIMAVCWGPGTPPTTFAILDPFGNMVDYLHCPQLSGTIPRARMRQGETYNIFADPKKGKDALAARTFIENHLPHAIVIGIGHCEAFNLREDIKTILGQILDDNPRALLSLETGGILAIPSPEEVATLWEHSEAGKEQMPSSLPIVRRAVALGRQMLDPLAVLASVCGSSKEILSLPLHPLQSALSNEERMVAVEETMCSAVAQVGVDINLAVSHPWMAAPLEFVPGLGPRKAQALIRAINRNGGVVESRKALYHDLGVLGKTVFHNASPYLRVRASTKAAANLELHPLDSTRVHPESYKLAVQIASSAVQNGDEDIAVESAMAAPNEVENLELDAYDEHLRAQDPKGEKKTTPSLAASAGGDDGADGAGAEGDADMREEAENNGANDIDAYLHSDNEETMNTTPPPVPGPRALRGHTRLATLIDIKFELIAPYGELRPRMPKEEALWADHTLLYLATGQGRESLKRGRKVEAKVRYVGEKMVRVTIPELNNIEAVINSDAVSSSKGPGTDGVDCRNHFRNNDTVIAVITAIDEKTRTLTLSTASKMVGDDVTWEHTYLKDRDIGDEAYMVPTQKEINEEKLQSRGAGARKAKGPRVIRRAIKHPLFQNIQMADAASSLLEGNVPVGTALVRPGKSSRGLYLTMRQPGDKIWHIAIAEKGKPSAGLGLATPISVEPVPGKESEYDDLDEFSFRFVEPVAAAMRALVSHRKWRGGDATLQQLPVSWYELQQQLKAERQQHPVAAAYALAADEQRPGAFYLGYILSSTPKREFFVVLPDGFYFRKKMHKTVDHMIAAFKAKPRAVDGHEDERRQQQQRQQQQQQAQQQDQGYAQPQAQQYQQYQQQYPGQTYQDPAQYQDYYNAGGGGGYFGATVADPYAQEQQAYQYQQYPQQQPQQGQQPDPYSQGGWR